jgi:hypothetical protein
MRYVILSNGLIFGMFAFMEFFNDFNSSSRIWVYAANRVLNNEEQTSILQQAKGFCENWTAHQQQLKADAVILYNLFVIFAVDETKSAVSGCGIDKSVHFMQSLSQNTGIDFFNRMQIEMLDDEQISVLNTATLKALHEQGKLATNLRFANKNIHTLQQLRNDFMLPMEKSWFYSKIVSLQTH